MKVIFIFLMCFLTHSTFAKEFNLINAKIEYSIKFVLNNVKGETKDVSGKMRCEDSLCDFIATVPVKSFDSNNSQRDQHMTEVTEIDKYPLASAEGKFPEDEFLKGNFKFRAKINFHGVEKEYTIEVKRKDGKSTGFFVLLLEDHKIVRPKLFAVPIDNEAKINFSFIWKEIRERHSSSSSFRFSNLHRIRK